MNLLVLGWFLPVLELKGESMPRLRPSFPTVNFFRRICPRLLRSSQSGASLGKAFAIILKVASFMSGLPEGSSGQGIRCRRRYSVKRSRLKVVPSYTWYLQSTLLISLV